MILILIFRAAWADKVITRAATVDDKDITVKLDQGSLVISLFELLNEDKDYCKTGGWSCGSFIHSNFQVTKSWGIRSHEDY